MEEDDVVQGSNHRIPQFATSKLQEQHIKEETLLQRLDDIVYSSIFDPTQI